MSINAPFLKSGSRSPYRGAWMLLALMIPASIYSFLYQPSFILQLISYALFGSMAETLFTAIFKRKIIRIEEDFLSIFVLVIIAQLQLHFLPDREEKLFNC